MFDMRKIAKRLLLIVGVVVVIEMVDTALSLWAWRTRNPRALHLKKRFNKYYVVMLQTHCESTSTH